MKSRTKYDLTLTFEFDLDLEKFTEVKIFETSVKEN